MKMNFSIVAWASILIVCRIGVTVAAVTAHFSGASATDVSLIESAVAHLRHENAASVVWHIAVNGKYALAFDGCTPGACNETQLIYKNGMWTVSCYTVEGKGRIGICTIPDDNQRSLRTAALQDYHGS